MRRRIRFQNEDGAVLLIVAMVMLPLIILSAGGISVFTLYGAHREMQKAADQAAVAAAAALPPLNPNVVFANLPFPIPNTDPVFVLTGDQGLDTPLLSELVPDPRAVACAYGADGMSSGSAALIALFGVPPTSPPPTLCSDTRISPTMQSTPVYDCLEHVVGTLTSRLEILGTDPLLALLLPNVLSAVLTPVQRLVNGLNQAVPAALSPTMKVEVSSGVRPPMLNVITGEEGIDMRVRATAARRLKNAVVIPLVSGGQVGPVVTNDVNLNTALAASQPALINTLGDVDDQVDALMSSLSLANCQNLLSGVQQDLGDIYNPPSGPAPTAGHIIKESVTAAESTAAATGIALSALAGDAYYAIGAGPPAGSIGSIVSHVVGPLLAPTALALLGPITATQIPTLDVAIVLFTDIGNQNYHATIIDAANARGLFGAVLVG